MTIELHGADPYCTEFRAQVRRIGPQYVILDQTYFFPRSSEQLSDVGEIDSVPIIGAERVDDEIRHATNGSSQAELDWLLVGDIVTCRIDRQRRLRTMRLHTAQHLLRLALEVYNIKPIGGFVDLLAATVIVPERDAANLCAGTVAKWIEAAVESGFEPVHELDHSLHRKRYWSIDGLAALPCDGTHVRSTAEVGQVSVGTRSPEDGTIEVVVKLV